MAGKLLAVLGAAFAVGAVFAAPASAGRLLITGHDIDFHCAGEQQCHFVEVATDYVRGGAPDPSRPVLVLDRAQRTFPQALINAFGDAPPHVVMDPRSITFASEPLTTSRYSAILVASDITCGGCSLNEFESTPDSDAISARKADIVAFFNGGGGLLAGSGARHGDGDPATGADTYYDFLPIDAQGKRVTEPFCLTDAGKALGFEDQSCPDASKRNGTRDDINCCATHNSFQEPPSGGTLRVAERDADGAPQTLFADGTIVDGGLVPPPPTAYATANIGRVRGALRFRRPGERSFTVLSSTTQIPLGSTIDASRGVVRLRTEKRPGSAEQQRADFSQGQFKVRQVRSPGRSGTRKPVTEVHLSEPLARCPRASAGDVSSSRRRTRRRVFGSGRGGLFRTVGRHSSATVRGTKWLVEDRCDGTLTVVKQGKVAVRDFRRRKTVIVRAGKRYLARARR